MVVTHQSRLLSRSVTSSPPLLTDDRLVQTRGDSTGFILHRPEAVYAEVGPRDRREGEVIPLGPVKETAL